ncbi:MAG: hypothetical protein FJX72_05950 [Armatimonadetes bacterium]|nr:hypothetical protein [Armatimonadota bacterium]
MRVVRCTRAIAVSAAIAVVVGLGAYRASADTPAVTITEGNKVSPNNQTLGWRFTTSEDLYVTQLGFWDQLGDGLQQSHQIGIWQFGSPGTPVIQATIPSGTGMTLDGGFRWIGIAPTLLGSGT